MSSVADYALAGVTARPSPEIGGTLAPYLGRPSADAFVVPRRAPWLMNVLVAACLLPEESSFQIGGLRFTIARAILVLIAPYICFRFVAMMIRPGYRFVASDILVPLAGLWMFTSITVVQGIQMAAASAGNQVLEFCMTYIAARALVRCDEDVLSVVKTICLSVSLVALLSLLDSASGTYVVHNWFHSVTGYVRAFQIDYRMGLLRASGTLEHPILLGTVCAISCLLVPLLRPGLRVPLGVCSLIGLIFSFSAAPLSGLIIGVGITIYDYMFRQVRERWTILSIAALTVISLVFIFANNPISRLCDFTFDPDSAYYRTLIWHYGTAALMQSPVFGIGLYTEWAREDWMSKSVDTFWLMSAMTYGIPGCFLMATAWVTPFLWPAEREKPDADHEISSQGARTTLGIIMVHVVIVGFTVYFWGATWMLISIIVGLRAHLGSNPQASVLS